MALNITTTTTDRIFTMTASEVTSMLECISLQRETLARSLDALAQAHPDTYWTRQDYLAQVELANMLNDMEALAEERQVELAPSLVVSFR